MSLLSYGYLTVMLRLSFGKGSICIRKRCGKSLLQVHIWVRATLPDCLPFSKPKVNWLLHLVMVSRKQLLTRYPLQASVVNRSDRCETMARRRQKQIESKLTRDLYNKKSCPNRQLFSIEGAVSGTRTRDPQLGKLMLYQLSYYRRARRARTSD